MTSFGENVYSKRKRFAARFRALPMKSWSITAALKTSYWLAFRPGAHRWRGGWPVASKPLKEVVVPVGRLDITLYRDDLEREHFRPNVRETQIPVDLTEKHVVLVDDVLYTGRTIRGCDGCGDGLTAVRVRSNLPYSSIAGTASCQFAPDYVGKNVPTSRLPRRSSFTSWRPTARTRSSWCPRRRRTS